MDALSPVGVLVASLERIGTLDAESRVLLEALSFHRKTFAPHEQIVQAGEHCTHSCLLTDGFAARAHFLADGGRQLDQIHLTGDFVDLHSLHLVEMDHSVVAIGKCEVAFVAHEALSAAMSKSARLTWLFWQSTVLDGAQTRVWLSCLGRRHADAALAHLACEIAFRLRARSVVDHPTRFSCPATQVDLADMLGLTPVHVCRTLRNMRALGLLRWSHGEIELLDEAGLVELADFDPAYLMPGRPIPNGLNSANWTSQPLQNVSSFPNAHSNWEPLGRLS